MTRAKPKALAGWMRQSKVRSNIFEFTNNPDYPSGHFDLSASKTLISWFIDQISPLPEGKRGWHEVEVSIRARIKRGRPKKVKV